MSDVLIVGGGVIGLSLAYELAGQGARVRLVDRGPLGREASWAGAGILPPGSRQPTNDPIGELHRLSDELYPIWSARLREETGVDNGFCICGGIYLATGDQERKELQQSAATWHAHGVRAERLGGDALAKREPSLATGLASQADCVAWWLPDEAQVRNPRHLKALALGCVRRGVELEPGVAVEGFKAASGRVISALTAQGEIACEQVCIAGGPWSGGLVSQLGAKVMVRPKRGQMVLLSSPRPVLRSIVNIGHQYLVPRPDGRILIGSTVEDAGFDKRTTAQAIAGLLDLAVRVAPPLANLSLEQCWAGLRPASHDDLPYIGRLADYDNAFLATGHFRSGLQLSPGTAVLMSQLMAGVAPTIDPRPFRVDRPADPLFAENAR